MGTGEALKAKIVIVTIAWAVAAVLLCSPSRSEEMSTFVGLIATPDLAMDESPNGIQAVLEALIHAEIDELAPIIADFQDDEFTKKEPPKKLVIEPSESLTIEGRKVEDESAEFIEKPRSNDLSNSRLELRATLQQTIEGVSETLDGFTFTLTGSITRKPLDFTDSEGTVAATAVNLSRALKVYLGDKTIRFEIGVGANTKVNTAPLPPDSQDPQRDIGGTTSIRVTW